jgi:hypothetical protein
MNSIIITLRNGRIDDILSHERILVHIIDHDSSKNYVFPVNIIDRSLLESFIKSLYGSKKIPSNCNYQLDVYDIINLIEEEEENG